MKPQPAITTTPARKAGLALGLLIAGIQASAIAATVVVRPRAAPMQSGFTVVRGEAPPRPLYSPQCEYKPVMSNLEMERCGVFFYNIPAPFVVVNRANRLAVPAYR
jgi:hypothetical protein